MTLVTLGGPTVAIRAVNIFDDKGTPCSGLTFLDAAWFVYAVKVLRLCRQWMAARTAFGAHCM